ncbi:hypothetical protein HSBAA_26090 [Vreelandella sulfidaeris]|uniref:Uncharacterized protein n=1 Tax=Vreelandella sulfidaeris TaxID=115553 RepID=A0A455U7Y0_9GAMM|nr:hypothetical protein HSBAA_26090 [Halomonas sulfidaeris]
MRRYEWALLEALEATPQFTTPEGSVLDPQLRYRFDAASRAFIAAERGLDGRTLRYIEQGDWQHEGLANALKAVMRAALAPHLGSTVLRSRELMLDLARRRHRP